MFTFVAVTMDGCGSRNNAPGVIKFQSIAGTGIPDRQVSMDGVPESTATAHE